MTDRWELHHEGDVKPFVVLLPRNTIDESSLPPYIKLTAGSKTEYFRTDTRFGAGGNQVWVSEQHFDGVKDGAPATFAEAPVSRYRFHRLLRDPELRLALIGLILAISGVVIDGLLAISTAQSAWSIPEQAAVNLMVLSLILKIVGLTLAFWKGILKGDI